MICVADIAPRKLKMLSAYTTAEVVPRSSMNGPIVKATMICARKIIPPTTAISVPKPRLCFVLVLVSFELLNWKRVENLDIKILSGSH